MFVFSSGFYDDDNNNMNMKQFSFDLRKMRWVSFLRNLLMKDDIYVWDQQQNVSTQMYKQKQKFEGPN